MPFSSTPTPIWATRWPRSPGEQVNGLGEHERETIRGVLGRLDRDVSLLLELGPEEAPTTVIAGGRELDFGAETQALLEHDVALEVYVTPT